MTQRILLFSFTLLLHFMNFAQGCDFQVIPSSSAVCVGDTVCIIANGSAPGASIGQFDFNTSGVPAGWVIDGTSFGQMCGPSPTGTDYYWSSTAVTGTPMVKTSPLDVSAGGIIQFDLVFGLQGAATPCDGPDFSNEGVNVQFSTDMGATWVDIVYFNPLGTFSPSSGGTASGPTAFTTWGSYCFPIPPVAQTPSTQFRWIQNQTSGADYDNWGLDEIVISNYQAGTSVSWSNGVSGISALCFPVTSDTTITAYLINSLGDTLSQDQAIITAVNPFSAFDTVSVCQHDDYTFSDGTVVSNITSSITHASVFQNVNGCDSTITTTVVPVVVNTSVTQTDSTVTASNAGAGVSYTWLDCSNGSQAIPGEISQTLNPAQPGSYAVIVTENGCSDTSSCVTVSNLVQLDEMIESSISIYPNPTTGEFKIDLGSIHSKVDVRIVDAVGSVVLNRHFETMEVIDLNLTGSSGLYLIELSVADQRFVYVLSKQ